jgi:arylsulfatase A-like enzyme
VIRRIWFGLAGGLIAGSIVGLGEALFILAGSPTGEYVALVYAAVLYGLIGAGMGTAVGVGLAVLGMLTKRLTDPLAWSLGFVGVLLPLGLVITRYIVNKAVYAEAGVPMPVMVGILVGFVLLGVLDLWLGSILMSRTPLKVMLQPKGTVAAWSGIVALSALFSLAPGNSSAQDLAFTPDGDPADGAPDIVLVVVDTLRSDHLGPYGHTGGLTPNIDALADEAVVFDQYVTHASWTRASFASLYTSMLPSGHKSILKAEALPDDVETLAETLSKQGYVTGGMPNNINVTASFNFQQGFDWFEYQKPSYIAGATESAAQLSMYNVVRKIRDRLAGDDRTVTDYYQPAEVVLPRARQFISANREAGHRYLLVIHLMEPHDPYFNHPYDGAAVGRAWYPNPDPSEAGKLKAMYGEEVRWMDQELGGFIDWMKAEGAWNDTLFVLTADHGEEFYEHEGWWHGITLYDEQIHVPLVMKLPGGDRAGQRVPWQVRQVDVSPTLVDFAGGVQPPIWQGQTLFDTDAKRTLDQLNAPPPPPAPEGEGDAAEGEDAPDADTPNADTPDADANVVSVETLARTAVSEQNFEGNDLQSIRKGGMKFIKANEGNPRGLETAELYDIAADPTEQSNLAGSRAADQAALEQEMLDTIEAAKDPNVGTQTTEISCDECQSLMALGYQDNCDAACGGG